MPRTVLFLVLAALLAGAGCSVPPSRLANDVRGMKGKLAAMEKAVAEERWEAALASAREIVELGDELSGRILLGDPLRQTVDEALAKAREVRERIRAEDAPRPAAGRRNLEEMAKKALADAAANTKEPAGPPEGAESLAFLAAAPAGARAAAAAADAVGIAASDADADADLDRHRAVVEGDRAGDVADDEIAARRKKEEKAKQDAPRKLRIDENTPPVVIREKPVTKGKSVAAYFTVVNKTEDFEYVVSVNADFLRESGASLGFANATFKVEGFVPNWDDILASQGETLTGDGFAVGPKSGLALVAVGMKPEVGKVEKTKLEVRMRGDNVRRATGPGEPAEEKE